MEKKKIGFDLDDTLLDTASAVVSFFNEKKGTSYTMPDLKGKNTNDFFGVTSENMRRVYEEFFSSEHSAQIQLRPGAREVIDELAQYFELHIVTARSIEITANTLYSLSQHFSPDSFARVHFINSRMDSNNVHKYEVCHNHGIELLVDDYHATINTAAESGLSSILIDTSWNKEKVMHQKVYRAKDLFEVRDIIYQLLQ